MKFLLTAIIASIAFIGTSQAPTWDQRYEKAKFEQREGISETYWTDVLNVNGEFSRSDLFSMEEHLEENPNFFKIEFTKNGTLRFYHKSNIDGAYILDEMTKAFGTEDFELGEMSEYKFE